VPHGLKHMNLVDGILSLLTVHLRDIDDLHDVRLSVSHRLNEDRKTE
jgi:hypothetical protein